MALILPALLMGLTLVSYTDADVDIYQELAAIKTQLDVLQKYVYFKATFSDFVASCKAGKTVIFDHLWINRGKAYNRTTGVFTAPYNGDYVFAYQTFTVGAADANWDFYINGQMVLRARSKTSGDTSIANVLPITLQAGDRVYVRNRYDLKFYGLRHSFFSGWLLRAS